MITKNVLLDNLGICEYCGVLLDMEDMPKVKFVDMICPKCGGRLGEYKVIEHNWLETLTVDSFGWRRTILSGWRKTRWVGKRGKWRKTRPKEDFVLGNWKILVRPRILRSLKAG